MDGITRRDLSRIALAAGLAAFVPAPARAVPASAVLSVASAGFELYKLSRDGGGGIGKLLAAQVKMLQAISAQLVAIGDTVIKIYNGINDLKSMVERLPVETSIQIARDQILNSVKEGAGLLDEIHSRSKDYGPEVARDTSATQNASLVVSLRGHVGTVMRGGSVADAPLICLAWYCELQLMIAAPELNLLQLNRRAKEYAPVLAAHVATASNVLGIAASDAAAMRKQVAEAASYDGTQCNTDWREDIDYGGTYGKEYTWERPIAWYNSHKLSTAPEQSDETLILYLRELAVLEAAGVDVASDIEDLSIPRWKLDTQDITWTPGWVGEGSAARHLKARRAAFNASQCPAGLTPPKPFADRQNALMQKAEAARLKAVVHYHLLLAAREALASTQTIAQRTT